MITSNSSFQTDVLVFTKNRNKNLLRFILFISALKSFKDVA